MQLSRRTSFRILHSSVLLLLFVPGLISCGTALEQSEEDPGLTTEALFSPQGTTLFPSNTINVCWRGSITGSAYDADRALIELRIRESWGRYSALNFVGWSQCPNTIPSGSIVVEQGNYTHCPLGKSCSDIGPQSNGIAVVTYMGATNSNKVTLHEFGHALGFGHEYTSKANKDICAPGNGPGTDPGNRYIVPYDYYSIMNAGYCWDSTDDNSVALSPWDIVALQNAYGPSHNGSIVGVKDFCLDMNNDFTTPTSPKNLHAWTCDRFNSNQKWKLFTDNSLTNYGIQAIDYSGFNTIDASAFEENFWLYTWERAEVPQQRWKLDSVSLVGYGGLCLDVPGNNAVSGQRLQLYTCFGVNNGAQKWTIEASGTVIGTQPAYKIRLTENPSLCLEESGSVTYLSSCATVNGQTFTLSNGHIADIWNRCVGMYPSNSTVPQNGTPVGVYSCNATDYWTGTDYSTKTRLAAQRWYARGPIVSGGSPTQCIHMRGDIIGTGVTDGTPIDLATCEPSGPPGSFMWDFHF